MIDILSQRGVPVIPVNMVGVAGAGLALQAKERFSWFDSGYKWALKFGGLRLGSPVPMQNPRGEPEHIPGIVFFATKLHFRNPSSYDWIDEGLLELADMMDWHPILMKNHLWVPPLGCGLGGLWEPQVYELYKRHLGGHPRAHYVGMDGVEWTGGHAFFKNRPIDEGDAP